MAYLKSDPTDYIHINAVDTVNRRASGLWSDGSICNNGIDTSYHVGAVQVTPAVGDTWKARRNGPYLWILVQKMPSNTIELSGLTTPSEGQTQLGNTGPTELHGSQINAYSPIKLHTPATLPPVTQVGTMIYYGGAPLFSDGTNWKTAAGVVVS